MQHTNQFYKDIIEITNLMGLSGYAI